MGAPLTGRAPAKIPVPPPCGGNFGPRATVQPKMPARPVVPPPCGGNVGPRATVQPKMPAHPVVPPPCGGNVGPRATVQPKMPVHPVVPPPCGGNVGPRATVQPKMPAPAPWPAAVVQRSSEKKSSGSTMSTGKTAMTEEAILDRLSALEEAGLTNTEEYRTLSAKFNSFEKGSNVHEVKKDLSAAGVDSSILKLLDVASIRKAYYNFKYSSAATKAKDDYVKAHLKPSDSTQWECPGTDSKDPHFAAVGSATIDHRQSVADHWNKIGYNTDKATRREWYSEVKNHDYVCGSCNSSMGSGGKFYAKAPGPSFSST